MVDMHRARQGVQVHFLFKDKDTEPRPAQQIGRKAAYGTASHNDYIIGHDLSRL